MRKLAIVCLAALLFGCATKVAKQEKLASIQLYDRNGFQETISSEERLERYQKSDFSSPQPYTKVVRVFKRDDKGRSPGKVTTYHANGQLWQSLDVVNGRANGWFVEYHDNGKKKMQARVIEGKGELDEEAMLGWVFDGEGFIWDNCGNLTVEAMYENGKLEGKLIYYYPSGKVQMVHPYVHNELHGTQLTYDKKGNVLTRCNFSKGLQDGTTEHEGDENWPHYWESYKEGKLLEGTYYSKDEEILSRVENGKGIRLLFKNGDIYRRETIKNGIVEGEVWLYNSNILENYFTLKDGKKHGQEWVYYPPLGEQFIELDPKMMIEWYEGEMHGTVKTWYRGRKLESQRDMVRNCKHGLSTCWYPNRDIMLVEEYDEGKLLKGKYLKKNDKVPVSEVKGGNGIATIYDSDGYFVRKIKYAQGKIITK
ncbi:MAG: hypothetical protein MRY21_00895 [Simkaniaceae bacterium]|nr:hypothetical protein [Simkaniaceae bacterium]